NGWNNNKGDTRSIDEFRLVGDIDFSGKEYNDGYVVGNKDNYFTANFNGQGYTLKNITVSKYYDDYVGIFGAVGNNSISNFFVDNVKFYRGGWPVLGGLIGYAYNSNISNIYLNGVTITSNGNIQYVGGVVGYSYGSTFENISLKNIDIKADFNDGADYHPAAMHYGGFIGYSKNDGFSDISLSDIYIDVHVGRGIFIGQPYGPAVGGFAGSIYGNGQVNNISIENIERIYLKAHGIGEAGAGGFVGIINGNTTFNNITINNINEIIFEHIYDNPSGGAIGGFAGWIVENSGIAFKNIALNNVKKIYSSDSATYQGGFLGATYSVKDSVNNGKNSFENIYIYFNEKAEMGNKKTGLFAGEFGNNNVINSNIHIYYQNNTLENANSDSSFWNDFNSNGYVSDKVNLHTYTQNNAEEAYNDFLSKAETIIKPTPPNIDGGDNGDNNTDSGLSDVILSRDDFDSSIISGILDEIL
ncbi:GLUG motif-containing protein, partial [Helicobacter burdigaliensis]